MQSGRLDFVDNLRLAMIVLVVVMHAAVTYSGFGAWYYKQPQPLSPWEVLFFATFQSFLQAFFMGLLFMAAGYFAAMSLERKGAGEFARGRLARLGLPTLAYALVVHPVTVYWLADIGGLQARTGWWEYLGWYMGSLRFVGGTGPMWFALALLAFSLVHAALARPGGAQARDGGGRVGVAGVAGLVLLASAGAFALRLTWPIGTSVLNMQFCFFSQYVILYVVGVMAFRRGWLDRLTPGFGRGLVWTALALAPVLAVFFVLARGSQAGVEAFRGGFTWQSGFYALWESATGVCMSLGLWAVFRERFPRKGALAAWGSANAFAVYMFHTPVLVLVSLAVRGVHWAALPKFLLVSALGVPASFLAAWALRKLPGVAALTRS
ncbi:Glucans biosynthesis protein C [Fundidesulfovibrio magnetotacticus]|uniref:Glucans biosynthesis protein C n=1 Tax=Fundidesulfovibrio magnetotacticus TaxID=2730080 RepID=A0A6V8LYU4_9BACT|nr:acyltransferase family protein [Fundidesulfovibrio magnetotacticus]GFK94817.1 Glucans biosynthesis protein C [Fundidesulfovibrio magnetotacticus]